MKSPYGSVSKRFERLSLRFCIAQALSSPWKLSCSLLDRNSLAVPLRSRYLRNLFPWRWVLDTPTPLLGTIQPANTRLVPAGEVYPPVSSSQPPSTRTASLRKHCDVYRSLLGTSGAMRILTSTVHETRFIIIMCLYPGNLIQSP